MVLQFNLGTLKESCDFCFTGFALIIDRRSTDFSQVRRTFQRLVTLFPARIREVYLLHGPSGLQQKDLLINQLIEEFLLDFDIFHLNEASELMHHLEPKFIPSELGGHLVNDIEGWLLLQEHVETFSFSARRIARRLAQFVGVLNQVQNCRVFQRFFALIIEGFEFNCPLFETFGQNGYSHCV